MGNSKNSDFPDVDTKLGVLSNKKSVFERQKQEAEAKRLKEQQETAAVYEDFVKSFDDDGNDDSAPSGTRGGGGFSGPMIGGSSSGFSKRHFSSAQSGRGGRASGPGSLGPPQSTFTKKRTFDGGPPQRENPRGMFAFDEGHGSTSAKAAFQASDDEDEKGESTSRAQERAVHKPTLHLSSLPPGTSTAFIKSIMPSNIKVDGVRLLHGSGPGSAERRGQSAIVTVAADTPAGDLDSVVSALQKKYLGQGFYLTLSRHLSSAVVGNLPTSSTSTPTLPFGAKPAQQPGGRGFPPVGRGGRGGFAPSPSLGSSYGRPPPVHVAVAPPHDLKQLKLIHKTIESLIKHGPEFEALLMSRPEVQKEEKWAWIWDPTSIGGVWYRWRLWDVLTSAKIRQKNKRGPNDGQSQIVFDSGAPWTAPERVLPFEYSTTVQEFVSDSDYNSSSEDDSGDEGRRRFNQLQSGAPPDQNPAEPTDEITYLNPLHKAKLVHLLSRLPDTTAKLRRGDVARVTAFAIQHAGEGAEEVVNLLTLNVHTPFSLAAAKASTSTDADADADDSRPAFGSNPTEQQQEIDPSQHKLISLYLISDILSSSSTSGVRHAWRYRQLFENALKAQQTFAKLGRVEKDLKWGRLRAEKWKRSVNAVLTLWEGWCVFPAQAQEGFREVFERPPVSEAEKEEERRKEEEREKEKGKRRWKALGEEMENEGVMDTGKQDRVDDREAMEDVDGEPMEDVDGEPMEDVDGEPMDEDVDGEEMVDDDDQPAITAPADTPTQEAPPPPPSEGPEAATRRRPRAMDMFGDSDGE